MKKNIGFVAIVLAVIVLSGTSDKEAKPNGLKHGELLELTPIKVKHL